MAIHITDPEQFIEIKIKDAAKNTSLKNARGVYVLFDKLGRPLYVGQSRNLRNRLQNHKNGDGTSDLFYKEIDFVRIYFVDDPYDRDIYETHFIRKLRPPYNRAKTADSDAVKMKEERMYELEVLIYELEQEIKDIKTPSGGDEDYAYYTYDDKIELVRLPELEKTLNRYKKELASIKSSLV